MKNFIKSILVLFFILILFSPFANADGVVLIKKSRNDESLVKSRVIKMPTKEFKIYERCVDKGSKEIFNSFISPTQQAIIAYKDQKETLILQVAPPPGIKDFVWIIPVPSKPELIETTDPALFTEIFNRVFDKLFGEFYLSYYRVFEKQNNIKKSFGIFKGTPYYFHGKNVDNYKWDVFEAKDPYLLMSWLDKEGYSFPAKGKESLNLYVEKNWYYIAIKVCNPKLLKEMKPIKIVFKTKEPVYPLKITSLEEGRSKINLYVFSDKEAGFDYGYRIWYGPNKRFSSVFKNFPKKLTVLNLDILNKEIEDDCIIFNKPSMALVIPFYKVSILIIPIILTIGAILILNKKMPVVDIDKKDRENLKNDEIERKLRKLDRLRTLKILFISFIIIFLPAYTVNYSRYLKKKASFNSCRKNLKYIGDLVQSYKNDNFSSHPTSLHKLKYKYWKKNLYCPYSKDDSYSRGYLYHDNPSGFTLFCKNRHINFLKTNQSLVTFPPCGSLRIVIDTGK